MSIATEIKSTNESARSVHGADIRILAARGKCFGHEDNLILVMGENHAAAAADIARMTPGATIKQETCTDFVTEKSYTYSSVSF